MSTAKNAPPHPVSNYRQRSLAFEDLRTNGNLGKLAGELSTAGGLQSVAGYFGAREFSLEALPESLRKSFRRRSISLTGCSRYLKNVVPVCETITKYATMNEAETITELDLGCTPEAAVSGAVLVQTERTTFLTFKAMRPTDRMSPFGRPYREDAGCALVEFEMCSITKFGYPNDEAWSGIPRTRGLSYGIYEVHNSGWIRELTALNRHSFPSTPDDTRSRHFLLLFHDSSFECIADGIKLELISRPYRNVFARITERVLAE